MKTIDFSYFIERYNAGEMTDTEQVWFQKELEGNEKLRNEVNLRKRTEEILKKPDVISLRNKLSQIEKNRKESNTPVKKPGRSAVLKYAAVVTTMVVIGSIALFSGGKMSGDEIINHYYKAYQPPSVERSVKSAPDADFTLALEFYNIRDYKNAAVYFNKVLESNPKDMQTVLLSGVSNYEDQKYPEAELSFNKVIDDNDNLYIETAEWYLALCYIKTDEKGKAITQLQSIKNEGKFYAKDAKKIIRKLK